MLVLLSLPPFNAVRNPGTMVSPTFRVGLPPQLNLSRKDPHRQAQRYSSQVILNTVKLTEIILPYPASLSRGFYM